MTFALLEKGRFYGWINLIVCSLFFCIMSGTLMMSFGIFLPFLCEEFGWSRGSISWAMTINNLAMGFGAPLAGMFISKYGVRRAVCTGTPLSVLGLVLLAFHSHLWQLYLGYGLLCGLGVSLGGFLAITTIVNDWFVKKRSLALAIAMSSSGLGGVILVPLIMKFINSVGWRDTYLILAASLLVVNMVIPGIFLRNKPEDLGQVPDGETASKPAEEHATKLSKDTYTTSVHFTFQEAIRTPALWLLTGFITLQLFVLQGIMTHQVAFLLDIGISKGLAAMAMGLMMGISTISRLGVGFLGLKYDIHPLAIGSMLFYIIGIVLLLFVGSLPMVIAYSAFLGIGIGGTMVTMLTLMPNYFGNTDYPRIVSITMPFSTIISSMGAPFAGFVRDTTGQYINAFQISLVIMIVALVCLILARPPLHPSLRTGKTLPVQD